MTLNETRQLGIEFERRIQTILPQKEFLDKLDTETIYSFLNLYQDKYMTEIYKSFDNVNSHNPVSEKIERILLPLLSFETYDGQDFLFTDVDAPYGRYILIRMPDDYQMYIKSSSLVSSMYFFKDNVPNGYVNVLLNKYMSLKEASDILETPNNSMRIMRTPVVVLGENKTVDNTSSFTMNVIHDRYTTIEEVVLVYYKKPNYFDIMTSTPCDLSIEAFDDIVTGAVALYIQYVAGLKNTDNKENKSEEQ